VSAFNRKRSKTKIHKLPTTGHQEKRGGGGLKKKPNPKPSPIQKRQRELDYYKTLKKSFQNPLEILKPIKKHL
jgi:hypothetical protein